VNTERCCAKKLAEFSMRNRDELDVFTDPEVERATIVA
jgi:hypothetical protein